jgi:hypothetical protein
MASTNAGFRCGVKSAINCRHSTGVNAVWMLAKRVWSFGSLFIFCFFMKFRLTLSDLEVYR